MARLLSVAQCLVISFALTIQDVGGVRTGRSYVEVASNQAPEAFTDGTLSVHEGDRGRSSVEVASNQAPEAFTDGTLSVHEGDRGRSYVEVASNQAPEAFTDDTLSVHEGDRLTLTCTATGTDPRRVFWFESTTLLLSSDRQDAKDKYSTTLVLDPIQAADDGRILACRLYSSTQDQKVTLKVQKILNRGFQLHISANPAGALSSEDIVKVHLGSKLELTCILQGVFPHHLSWWRGQEHIPTAGEMGLHTATSSLILNPVGVADHLKALTCRIDGSTIARTVTLEVQGIQDGMSQKVTSILEEIRRDPTLQAIGLTVALVCGLLLIIACVIKIKALKTYLKITKIHDQQVKVKQQEVSSSSSSRRGQAKTPSMKQSSKNQILASATLLPPRNAAEAGTENADQRDTNESDPINQDKDKEGEDNPTFVEEV